MPVKNHQPSVTVFLTDVVTTRTFRLAFTLMLALGMMVGAISKLGIAQRHFMAWSDLGIISLMPLVGTMELMLIGLVLLPRSRTFGLFLVLGYQLTWIVAYVGKDHWQHTVRASLLLALTLLALGYGSSVFRNHRSSSREG